jgi:predicted MFS family arabinose efflux permease
MELGTAFSLIFLTNLIKNMNHNFLLFVSMIIYAFGNIAYAYSEEYLAVNIIFRIISGIVNGILLVRSKLLNSNY